MARLSPGSPLETVQTPFGAVTTEGESSSKVHYDPYLNAIASVAVLADAVVSHFNAGATRDTSSNTTVGSWGVGTEVALGARIFGIAETYGVSDQKPAYPVGVRYWALPGRLQVDGTYGGQHASPANLSWISIGVRILW